MKTRFIKIAKAILVLLFWICVWWIISLTVGNEIILPSPLSVLTALSELCTTSLFYICILNSLSNVVIGILDGILLGVLLSFAAATVGIVRELLSPLVAIAKATPVASFIMVALVMIARPRIPAFITALIVFPVVYGNMLTALNSIDRRLVEVSTVYSFSRTEKIKYLYLPSVAPYFSAACRSSLGLAWKAGIAAEILAIPKDTIGQMIYSSKTSIDTTYVFAFTVTVIILSIIIEYVLTRLTNSLIGGRRKEVVGNA